MSTDSFGSGPPSGPDVPEAHVAPAKALKFSPIWFVPILAALVGGLVVWQSVSDLGPLVEIRFNKGHGIEAGKTQIKYKDVVVGTVEDVALADGLDQVIVKARMDKTVAPYLGDGTDFWIVDASITGTDLSGLGTLLSGSYIEVGWEGPAQRRKYDYVGLDTRPLTPPGAQGRHVTLRTEEASGFGIGSPVYFRRIVVGQVESRRLASDFSHVEYEAFIKAPYDRLIKPSTHFWNVSGLTVEAGADGLSMRMESIESLLLGGVSFGDIGVSVSTAELAEDSVFHVFASREQAEESRFDIMEGDGFLFMVTFEDSIEGLERGAPVEWQGIRIGLVRDVVLDLGDGPGNIADRSIYAVLEIQPGRVGLQDVEPERVRRAMSAWVGSGMRARLASGNLLTGKKIIQFVDKIGTEDADVDFAATPYPSIPTAPSEFGALAQSIEQIIADVAELPLDELVRSATDLLKNAGTLLGDPETKRLPAELSSLLSSFSGVAGNLETASKNVPSLIANLNRMADVGEATLGGLSPGSELYSDLSGAVRDLRDAARSLAGLAARLERNPNALITGR